MAISIFVVRALVETVERAGVERDALFEAARFDGSRIDQSDAQTTREEYDALVEGALRVTGDDALGLHMGETTTATAHGLVAHLVEHAKTLGDAFDALVRFHHLLTGREVWRLEKSGPYATFHNDVAMGSVRARRFRAEVAMAGFVRMIRHFARDAQPLRVDFVHAPPSYVHEYARIFGGAERFEQPTTGIVFDRHLLEATQLHGDPAVREALQAEAQRRLARLDRHATYAERVREYLERAAKDRRDMDAAARALGISARSLRRRLQEEGATYSDLLDQALASLAKRLLTDEERTIEETAYEMGFSAPSAFHKAFKRWTGITPNAFRSHRVSSDHARP